MKKVIFTLTSFFIYILSFSQSPVNLEVISAAGDYFAPEGSNITLSWTLGETVIETFAPTGSEIILTQGFQQPFNNRFAISGFVRYDNTAGTPMPNTKVVLVNAENKRIDSTYTDVSGYYIFYVENGVYTLVLSSSLPFKPAHVNSTDALLALRSFVGLYTIKDALVKKAANVDGSIDGKVTGTDALWINRRFVSIISAFKISDWQFESPTVTVSGENVNRDIYACVAGDINTDYKFTKTSDNDLAMQTDGIIIVNSGKDFEVPVYVNHELNLGSFNLVFKYPSGSVVVKEVISSLEGLVYNIIDGEVRIAWSDYGINGVNFSSKNPLIVLKMASNNINKDEELQLELGSESLLGSNNAEVVRGEILYSPKIALETVSSGFYLGQNFPNPFMQNTQIEYRLPVDANVSLKLYNLMGEQVSDVINKYQAAGYYKIDFNSADIADGVYMYKMDIIGKSIRASKTKMMIISR